jgi:ribosomal protein L7Ae-like RNA K-turn-binding protein
MKKLLSLIGLGYRAGKVSIGVERVKDDLRAGRVHCVVVADDASERANDKAVRLAVARGIPVVGGPSAQALGAELGKPPVMVVGLRDRSLTDGILSLELEAVRR